MSPSKRPVQPSLHQQAADCFAARLKALEPPAALNHEAIRCCFDVLDVNDPGDAKLIANSLALALSQLRLLVAPCLLYVDALERINDEAELEAELG